MVSTKSIPNTYLRECVSTGAADARTRRSFGHHLLHPLILRLLVLCAPADFEAQSSLFQIQISNECPAILAIKLFQQVNSLLILPMMARPRVFSIFCIEAFNHPSSRLTLSTQLQADLNWVQLNQLKKTLIHCENLASHYPEKLGHKFANHLQEKLIHCNKFSGLKELIYCRRTSRNEFKF